ncbi:MAG: 2'-5' RNA ligase family protein [Pyrinomonadaceae bacterium]
MGTENSDSGMSLTPPPPFVLTLKLDAHSFEALNALRQRYFPVHKNFLPAHVTLFHALPGDQDEAVRQTLRTVCSETTAFALSFPKLRFLGKGVAVEIECPELIALRRQLSTSWANWLSQQDRQSLRPHRYNQNKASPEEAQQLYEQLIGSWKLRPGRGEGLLLWRYLGGPWEMAAEIPFQQVSHGQS